jgi:hypothetical protein
MEEIVPGAIVKPEDSFSAFSKTDGDPRFGRTA